MFTSQKKQPKPPPPRIGCVGDCVSLSKVKVQLKLLNLPTLLLGHLGSGFSKLSGIKMGTGLKQPKTNHPISKQYN